MMIRYDFLESIQYEQYSNELQLDITSRWVNFSYEMGQIMIIYDFMKARRVILSNVRTDSHLT